MNKRPGIVAELSTLIVSFQQQVPHFRIDRLEVREDAMRDMESDVARIFGNTLREREPGRELSFAGVPMVEVSKPDAPVVALVIDVNYKVASPSEVFR